MQWRGKFGCRLRRPPAVPIAGLSAKGVVARCAEFHCQCARSAKTKMTSPQKPMSHRSSSRAALFSRDLVKYAGYGHTAG